MSIELSPGYLLQLLGDHKGCTLPPTVVAELAVIPSN